MTIKHTAWMAVGAVLLLSAGPASAFSQVMPDLTVTGIVLEPKAPKPLELTLVRATVKNEGQGAAESFRVVLRVDGKFASSQRVDGLNPNETEVVTFQWFGLEGRRTLRVEVNGFNDVEESNHANNTLESTVDVLPAPLPDLAIESVRSVPQHPTPGTSAVLEVVVRNLGRIAPTQRAILVAKDGRRTLRTLFLDPLGPGQAVTLEIPWRPSEGEGLLSFEVDAQERIKEVSELNNLITQVYNVSSRPVTGAQLSVTQIDLIPANAAAGQLVAVAVTVVNAGQGVAEDFGVRVEVDGQEVTTLRIPRLNPGAQTQVQAQWQVTQDGEHAVRAKADAGGVIVEEDETDNVLTDFVQTGAALNACGQAVYLSLDEAGLQLLSGTLGLTLEQVQNQFMPMVKHEMEKDYEGLNIRFFLKEPRQTHSTVRFIGEARRDRLGEAPVDTGNFIHNDSGTVFLGSFDTLLAGGRTLEAFAVLIANTSSHESGHFLGLRHDDRATTQSFGGRNMMADGGDVPGGSVFLDAFFTEANLTYLMGILPLACNR